MDTECNDKQPAPDALAAPAPGPAGAGEATFVGRAFTLKAILFGLLGVCVINLFAGFNDDRLHGTLFIGNHLPNGTWFLIFCLILVWNPLAALAGRFLGAWGKRLLMFNTGEFVVSLSLMLLGSWTPTSGLYRYFLRQLIMPWGYLTSKPAWKEHELLNALPQGVFPLGDRLHDGQIISDLATNPDTMKVYDQVYTNFINGAGTGNSMLSIDKLLDIFSYWQPALLWYWVPLLGLFTLSVVGMSLIVHRQWAHHEQLSYPIAVITSGLIRRESGRVLPDIFYSRMFQISALLVLFIQLLRLGGAWFPNVIPAPVLNWWWPVANLFPTINQAGAPWGIQNGTLFFSIVGISYFLASEIGFTMGVSNILLAIVVCQYYLSTGRQVSGGDQDNLRAGAYVGYALILLYTGRDYYWKVVKRALFIEKAATEDDQNAFLAAWLLLLSFAGMVGLLVWGMHLDWLLALIYCLILMLFFLVFTRIVCETGLPFLQTGWVPSGLMLKGLGATFIGGKAIAFLNWMSTILAQDPRECLMPFMANSLKVADDNKVRIRPLVLCGFVALALALGVGFFAKFATIYSYGAHDDGWAAVTPPQSPFDEAARTVASMKATGVLEAATAATGLDKIAHVSPDLRDLGFILVGLAGVVVFSFLRFRFTNWPLHPVLFLIWGTYPSQCMAYAFLIGWAVKALIVYFGGGRIYQQLKPVFLGLIVGELMAAALGIAVGIVYYFVTDQNPVAFGIFPS
ncbi:MAG: hypothetical protein J6333_01440 [Planctomycetes bacterium]|nr:hypothetical protein [Planctomycetota bacterium]